MDAVVQFIRNALCCVKDLQLLQDTFLYDATVTLRYLGDLPPPLDQTTPLEVVISITQLYACLVTARSGWVLVTTSVGKLKRIVRLLEHGMIVPKTTTTTTTTTSTAHRIVHESLFKEAKFAIRSILIGMLLMPIGGAFWWLFLNSWHVTSVDWYGGLPALIHALEVMEVCLLPLLYFMLVDGRERLRKAQQAARASLLWSRGTPSLEKEQQQQLGIATYETMTDWVPFWDGGIPMFAKVNIPQEQDMLQQEVEKVQRQLELWFPIIQDDNNNKKQKKDSSNDGEKQDKLSKEALQVAQDKLEVAARRFQWEGYREFLYFLLNFVAFYGYLMAPVTFYFDDETVPQPATIRSLKFGYGNADADWTGNFAGDLMWTIEPVVILGSPILLGWIQPSSSRRRRRQADNNLKVKSE